MIGLSVLSIDGSRSRSARRAIDGETTRVFVALHESSVAREHSFSRERKRKSLVTSLAFMRATLRESTRSRANTNESTMSTRASRCAGALVLSHHRGGAECEGRDEKRTD